jgi:hypothetical protein
MRFANADKLYRKSGGAKPRDLQFSIPASTLDRRGFSILATAAA